MAVPVLTAVSDARWEAQLVAALGRGDLGVAVVRRCVDIADLLATAATGQAQAALLSADLRRLDREALGRLSVAGVAVVGLVPPGDEDAERRLRQLGVRHVLPSDSTPEGLSAAVVQRCRAWPSRRRGSAPPWPTRGPRCPARRRRPYPTTRPDRGQVASSPCGGRQGRPAARRWP